MTSRNPNLSFVDVWTRTPDFEVAKAALVANVKDNHKVLDILGDNEVVLVEGVRTQVGLWRHLVAEIHAASMGNISQLEPFEKGIVYAIPIRDGNKSVNIVKGEVTINDVYNGTNEEIHESLLRAIATKLAEDGFTDSDIILGNFSVPVSQPKCISEPEIRPATKMVKDGEEGEEGYKFIVYVDNVIHNIYSDLEEAVAVQEELLNAMSFRPGYKDSWFPRVDIVTVNTVQKTSFTKVNKTITYDFTARLYDISGDPDGWAFYGVKE